MPTDFKLPELGENVSGGDVIRVLVAPGDKVAKDQPVLELETDKATIEVPASVAGVVKDVKVKAGDKLKVGQVVLTVDEDGGQQRSASPPRAEKAEKAEEKGAEPAPPPAKRGAPERVEAAPRAKAETPERPASREKVPEGELEQHVGAEPRPSDEGRPGTLEPAGEGEATVQPPGRTRRGEVVDIRGGARAVHAPESESTADVAVAAAPSVRRLARELGVSIDDVSGSGPGGRVTDDDVKSYVRSVLEGMRQSGAGQALTEPLPDFAKWGDVDRKPMSGIRRRTAEHVSFAWRTVPHVTQFDRADITELERIRKRFEKSAEQAGGKLTMTAIAVKIAAAALKVFPQFNSSIDVQSEEIIYKHYVHIGVAVDTERGLLVPVIRDVDHKNIIEVSVELAHLAELARNRKLTREDLEGGCFTVTNLGGIGGTYFTPIVNAPEVAILGIARSSVEPVFAPDAEGQFESRVVLPLCLSYDHRVIDGADAIRFLRWVAQAFEEPFVLPLQG